MNALAPHQQRVVDEKSDLDTKIAALGKFFETPLFAGLDSAEVIRLRKQYDLMSQYSSILAQRIGAFQ